MIDKNYCMSSYLALRYIEKDDVDFYEGLHHKNLMPSKERILVKTAEDIDKELSRQLHTFKDKKKGIMLSGGMDSAVIASYLEGSDAYTFRFQGGEFQKEELERAEYYSDKYKLKLHYVDISWDTVIQYLEPCMRTKCAPVHSIEPQLLAAAEQAKKDGVELLVIGNSADPIFGGMDQLLEKDRTVEEFLERYIFTDPYKVLINPYDMSYVFERYRIENDKIDFLKFMEEIYSVESQSSYENAFETAKIHYIDPYAVLKTADPLDLDRIRNGESKYLIRELFKMKYPEYPVPNKNPMPRPVDSYFMNWGGPIRHEFKENLDMSKFTGNQKWQLYCLEKFLDMYEE